MSKRVERIFWFVTAIALGVYVLSLIETRVYQSYLEWQFAENLKAPQPAKLKGIPAAAAVRKLKPTEGQPLGRLDIPAIHLSAIIAEGVEASTLRRSIGHVPGTALPGPRGNVGLSGHRDTFFRHLGDLHKGDLISLTTPNGNLDYVVEATATVDPDESAVLRDVGRPMLTLVTCYPFYYMGPAPKRFVVHAGLVSY